MKTNQLTFRSVSGMDVQPPAVGTTDQFATTHWSMVVRASRPGESQSAALEDLCRHYWRPVYAFVRRRGHSPEEAQDLTQGFFERLLEKNWLAQVDPDRARFRSFLLTMVTRYVTNEFHRSHAQKRGGGVWTFSIHDEDLEHQLMADQSRFSPEQLFDRRWALTVLERAIQRLHEEAVQAGKESQFQALNPFLSQDADPGDYPALARKLSMSPGTVAVAVHRLRHRYRELVRAEIGETLARPADTEIELQHLFAALRS